jgi:anti-sigma factor RsiW
MNCEQARQTLFDSLDGPITAERRLLLEDHISKCEACRRFAEVQRTIDARLTAAAPVACLSSGFRASLQQKLSDPIVPGRQESLPDIAHLAGCGLGILLLLAIMPQYSKIVLAGGLGFTGVTYFLQAVLRNALDNLEQPS